MKHEYVYEYVCRPITDKDKKTNMQLYFYIKKQLKNEIEKSSLQFDKEKSYLLKIDVHVKTSKYGIVEYQEFFINELMKYANISKRNIKVVEASLVKIENSEQEKWVISFSEVEKEKTDG